MQYSSGTEASIALGGYGNWSITQTLNKSCLKIELGMMPQLIAINTEHAGVLNMVFKYSFNQDGKERQRKSKILVTISRAKKTEIILDSD